MDTIIYGIGGGPMKDKKMVGHYSRIVDLAQAQFTCETPEVAIVPTAHMNGTNEKIGRGYMDFIAETFADLGCSTREILIGDVPTGQRETESGDIQEILDHSHAVFVLGGDTKYLMNIMRERGLVPNFRETIEAGTVMSGTSAGLIWLTRHGMSDSQSFYLDEWSYVMIDGIGILPVAGNVHDNGPIPEGLAPQKSRREQFEEHFRQLGEIPGLAVDEFVGIEVRNGICQVRTPDPDIGVYVLANGADGVVRRRVDPSVTLDLNDARNLREFALAAQG